MSSAALSFESEADEPARLPVPHGERLGRDLTDLGQAEADAMSRRSDELHLFHLKTITARVDRSLACLLLFQWLACVALALWLSPKTWTGSVNATHIHVWSAWFLGGVITCLPVLLVAWQPGEVVTRHVVAAGQVLMSGLLIHVTGGRAETHFHIFGSLAFLAFYRDWKVLVTASLITATDQFVRGIYWPDSVFGVVAASPWRWLEHTGWIIFEDVFLIISILQNRTMIRDVSDRGAELEQARDLAEQANRAKDNFLAVLSHELRTPLTPSLAALSALASDSELSPETREEILMVQRNVELEARLIDDLLDLTRIATGKIQLVAGAVDVHAILTQILENSRGDLAKKQLTVARALDAKGHGVWGDTARLQQVFWNLIKNAIKFTPEGGRILVRTLQEGNSLRIEITDTGIGISEGVIPQLFRPFRQGGAEVTRRFGGLGLGLSICRAMVDLHRGEIDAYSAGLGKGATFTVILPLHGTEVSGGAAHHPQKPAFVSPRTHRILLVDDHTDTRLTLAKLLTRAGYAVTTAESVGSALNKAMEEKFDLVVSDIGLPDGTGRDLMTALRSRFGLRGIAFSGFGLEGDIRKSLEAGFTAHLTKPVDFQRLRAELDRALQAAV